jgi:hypothetical protein
MTNINLKPTIYANRGFDYFKLDPHEFEEITYHTFKHEIEFGRWKQKYDRINWLDKVGERGRDCTLHLNGETNGIIQCKHSKNNMHSFPKNDCIKEICKFLLHQGNDKSLIQDINNFTYYLVVSTKFSEDAQILLSSFKTNILNEPKLETHISSVLENNVRLKKTYTLKAAKEHLFSILRCLKIEMIIASDLDEILNEEHNKSILSRFFEVKTITLSEKEVEIPINEILKNFIEASVILSEHKNNFTGVNDSHLSRNETAELLNWINTTLSPNEENIALLVGKPGSGKSVILKDLFTILKTNKIPVLGLKADRYSATSVKNLEERIDLIASFEKLLCTLNQVYEQIVILIDQIDALSQTNSANGEFIGTYRALIHKLKQHSKVRIIISIRTYDLDYDFDFHSFKNLKRIGVSELTKEQVQKTIDKIGVSPISLTDSLYEVLKSPFNLDAFCRIYNQNIDINRFRTTTDLYKEIWEQKIVSLNEHFKHLRLKKCIYEIVNRMYEKQEIAIEKQHWVDDYFHEIKYLLKNNILIENLGYLQFFHQTFYDFVFAKQFCESKKDLISYIKQNWQGLKIRASFKMILAFYRSNDHQYYINLINKIIQSRSIRFHLKLLLINILASEPNPSKAEENTIRNHVLNNKSLCRNFLISINSIQWFNIVTTEYNFLLKDTGSNILYSLVTKHLPEHRAVIIPYCIKNLNCFSEYEIKRIPYFIKTWDFPDAFELLNLIEKQLFNDEHHFYEILIDISKIDINRALEMFKRNFTSKLDAIEYDNGRINLDLGHSAKKLLKHLYTENQPVAVKFNLNLVIDLIKKTEMNYPNKDRDLIMDHAFGWYTSVHHDQYAFLFDMLEENAKLIAQNEESTFISLFKTHFKTRYKTLMKIVLIGINSNPSSYIEDTYEIILYLNSLNFLESHNDETKLIRQILGKSYNRFNISQIENIDKILDGLAYTKDYHIREYGKTKKLHSFHGYTQFLYLQAIPTEQLKHNKQLHKRFLELKRRFNIVKDELSDKHLMAHIVGPPLSNTAYEKMNFASWRKSFLKFNVDFERAFGSHTGGIEQHCQVFRTKTTENPRKFIELVKETIINLNYDLDYAINGVQGIIESNDGINNEVKALLIRELINNRKITDYKIRSVVWIIDSLIQNEYIDDVLFEFLVKTVEEDNETSGINGTDDLISKGINSNSGAAAKSLTFIDFNPKLSNSIFNALENASKTKSELVKAAILYRLAFLNKIDEERSFNLFLRLTDANNFQLLKSSIWSLQYFRDKFIDRLESLFKRMILIKDLTNDVTTILTVGWLSGTEKCYSILKEYYRDSLEVKCTMLFVAQINIKKYNDEVDVKCLKIFKMFLNEKDKEIAQRYSYFFTHFNKDDFTKFYPLLFTYSKSNVCKINYGHFTEFLVKCANSFPDKCLVLLSNIISSSAKIEIHDEFYFEDESLNVIVHAYNGLFQHAKPKRSAIKFCLDLFDKNLKDSKNQYIIGRVIEEVDK